MKRGLDVLLSLPNADAERVAVTGLSATTAVGTVTVDAEANVTPTGQESTASAGSVSVITDQII